MKYIKRVTLENFQSHKHSVIDFDEQLNVIVGPSDSGKSAIIRGIKWVLYNEPTGDYFIKEGSTECSVTLEFNDGVKLQRYRSKYKNSYILTTRDGEEKKFEGFGSTIPEEIIETISIKKINLDSDESSSINLGEQLEGAFLLSEKGGTRASAIGRLVGVNIVDDALREALKDTRNLNIARKSIDVNIEKLECEISEYKYLDELKLKAINVERIRNNIIQLNHRLDRTKNLMLKLKGIYKEKENLSLIIIKFSNINEFSQIITTIENSNLKYQNVNRYNENLKSVKIRIKDGNNLLNKLKDVEQVDVKISYIDNKLMMFTKFKLLKSNSDQINNGINTGKKYLEKLAGIKSSDKNTEIITNKLDLLNKYQIIYNKMLTNNKGLQTANKDIREIDATIGKELELYQELLKKFEVCPFCLSSIDEDKISHIIEHYVGGN